MSCPDRRRAGFTRSQVVKGVERLHARLLHLSSLQEVVDAGFGIFGGSSNCMVHRSPVFVRFVHFRAIAELYQPPLSRGRREGEKVALVLFGDSLGKEGSETRGLIVLDRHGLADFAAGCVCAAWTMGASAVVRLDLMHGRSSFFGGLRVLLLLKLAERRRPEVDLVFLFAVCGSNVGSDETAEDGQAHEDDGPDRL